MIIGHGPSEPLAIFLGDGGGNEESISNYAFNGIQERTFQQLLGGTGLHWQQFYRTLLIKEKIDFTTLKIKTKKIPYHERPENVQKAALYQSQVAQEINQLKPNLIIPTGELAFQYLTGLSGIRKFRGSVLLARDVFELGKPLKVLPILGAQPYINQEFELRWVTKIDLGKIPKYINDSLPPEQQHRCWIAETSTALRTFFERAYDKDGLLVFDIETFMGMPTCISFCFDGYESVCVPFTDKNIDIDHRTLMIQLIAWMLASPIRKVNQNIKYDWKILERFGFKVNNVVGDTMLAASCLYSELPKGLGFLTSIYTDLPYFKDEGRMFDPSRHNKKQFYLYNAKDSLATHQIYGKQLDELNELGCRQVYDNLIRCLPLYRRMEDRGFRIDHTARIHKIGKYTALYDAHVWKIRRFLNNPDFKPSSSQQCNNLVYNVLGYKADRRASGTTEEELEYLMVFGEAKHSPVFGNEILKGIINCRKIHKVLEVLELYAWPDGRWRCEYNLAGAGTGRSTAGTSTDNLIIRNPKAGKHDFKIVDLGHSFQTFGKHGFLIDGEEYGKDIRDIFVPTYGHSFVEIDLSQAEARVDAVLSGNFDILSVFDGPIGIHRLTGSWVFDCKPEEIKKNTLQYLMAKTVRHAGERNMKADRLMMMTQQPLVECNRILNTFHKFQPEIQGVFHREVREAIDSTRTLVCPNGRKRVFLGRLGHEVYNQAISLIPQGVVTDQTKFEGMVPTFEQHPDCFPINEAHDGVLAEVPWGREGYYIEDYMKNVTKPIDFRRCTLYRDFELVIPAEASWSKESWYRLEDWKG